MGGESRLKGASRRQKGDGRSKWVPSGGSAKGEGGALFGNHLNNPRKKGASKKTIRAEVLQILCGDLLETSSSLDRGGVKKVCSWGRKDEGRLRGGFAGGNSSGEPRSRLGQLGGSLPIGFGGTETIV